MKKRRIRYSELGVRSDEKLSDGLTVGRSDEEQSDGLTVGRSDGQTADVSSSAVAVDADAQTPSRSDRQTVRPPDRPTSGTANPIDLARTLAAAQREEEQAAVVAVVESEPYRRIRDRIRARSGIAELLMFRLGGELFAVELLGVEEVIDLPVVHHVPEMLPAMVGVVNVRGSLTPIYTPHQVLGIPLAQRDAVLIFRSGNGRVGVLIDDVEDALTLDLRDLRDAPPTSDRSDVVLGVVRHAGSLVAIVDADALITACQTAVLVEIA